MNRLGLLLSLLLLSTSVFAAPAFDKRGQFRRSVPQIRDPRGETNAQRFARGLPPLPPRVRGTRTGTAKRTVPSDTPSVASVLGGKIVVRSSSGEVGVLQYSSSHGQYIPGSGSSGASFTFAGKSFQDDSTDYYLAGLIDPQTSLEPDNGNFAILGGAKPDGTSTISGKDYQSTIWSVDASTGKVTASWVNQDGSSLPEVSIAWDPVSSDIYLTDDFDGSKSKYPEAQLVTFSYA